MDATALAARLDLDLDAIGICFACLSIVSMALDSGDERSARREVNRMAPTSGRKASRFPCWLLSSVHVAPATTMLRVAIAEIERLGARSPVVKAIVRRLAQELSDRMHTEFDREFPKGRVVPIRPR